MKPKIAKYFWGFNEKALIETEKILKNPGHSRFMERLVTILSRCDKPRELFSFITKEEFVNLWPKVRNYWRKITSDSDFRDWWQTIYEQIVQGDYRKAEKPKGRGLSSFSKIGRIIREKRVRKGFTQQELALRTGIQQPDISKIEEGRKNITLETLVSLCKVLDIKKIEL